jgi:hypothetical protein
VASPSVRDSFIRYTSPVYPGASSTVVPPEPKMPEPRRNQMKPIPPFIYGIFHALQAL